MCGVHKYSEKKILQANINLVMLALSRRKGSWARECMGHDYQDDGGNHLTQIQMPGKAF